MKKDHFFAHFLAAVVGVALIVGLSSAGSHAFMLAVLGAPVVMGISGWLWENLSLAGRIATAAIVAAGMAATLSPASGIFFGSAIATGLLLPTLKKRRLGEDDWFFAVPLIFVAILAGISALDALFRQGAIWLEYESLLSGAIAQARQLNAEALSGRMLRGAEIARWAEGQRLLPFRMAGVVAGALMPLVIYAVLKAFRRGEEAVNVSDEGFARFRARDVYLLFLAAGLGALAVWQVQGARAWAFVGYPLVFLAGAGLFVQAVAVGAWFARRADLAAPVLLSGLAASLAVAAAPILAAAIAMVGLADVWLDFRRLD